MQNKLVIKHDYSADPDMGFSDGDTEYEKDQYYFYNDHLGSSSFVSDISGLPTHHIEYMPFGESFVNMKYSTWATPYTFNAKEQDCETGLHYYGARYYDARVGRFMSVDPLADSPANIAFSPYAYVWNNPINAIDPDGRHGESVDDWVEDKNGKIYWDKKATSQATTKKGEKYLGKNVLVGTHNRDAKGNEKVNSATFDLYLESDKTGPSATINGNTVPSDNTKSGTLAEGLYSAKFGHRNAKKYQNELAIRIYNLDGTDGLPTLNGNPNPKSNGKTLTGILFHKGNNYQSSLFDSKGNAYSLGCQTSGCSKNSLPAHNAFMKKVGKNFKGSYYLRSK